MIGDKMGHQTDIAGYVRDVEREYPDSDIVAWSGEILSPSDDEFMSLCERHSPLRKNLVLILSTLGGDADAAYRVARCIQRRWGLLGNERDRQRPKVSVFVDTVCGGAGTLIALGATELIMSENAELRPLEVKGSKLDQAGAKASRLTSNQALDILEQRFKSLFTEYFAQLRRDNDIGLSTRSAIEMASAVTPGLMAAVYGKLDPVKLAEADSAMEVAAGYAERLAKFNVKPGALTRLLTGYPSSHFIIDRSEADELFASVTAPKPALKALAERLRENSQLNAEHKAASFFLTGFGKGSDDQIPIQPLAPEVPAATKDVNQTVDRMEHIREPERTAVEPKRLVASPQLVKRGPHQETVTAVWHTGIYA